MGGHLIRPPGTINRELAALGRMASLARHQYGLVVPFVVTMLEERNVRTGFFDEDAFTAVCRALRAELAALATVAKLTGWRKSELRSRQWRHVDFVAGWLRLEPEETKNRDGRMFPLIPELRAVLEAQRARVEALQRETGRVIPWVFCRDDGAPVGNFKKAWRTACVAAGFFRVVPVLAADGTPRRRKDGTPVTVKQPTKLVHDFRRTAVRNLIRAGIPETVAMKMTGHRTRTCSSATRSWRRGCCGRPASNSPPVGSPATVAQSGPKVAKSPSCRAESPHS
jgi:integrase